MICFLGCISCTDIEPKKVYTVTDLKELLISSSKTKSLDDFLLPLESEFDKIPQDSLNPITKEKITLGKFLFFDPAISFDPKCKEAAQTFSCASCHSNYNAFSHTDHALSHGIYDSIGKRNAPPLINLAWQPIFMWDGARDTSSCSIRSTWHETKSKIIDHDGIPWHV